MSFIRTKLATDFKKPDTFLTRLLARLDNANPSYREKLHLVKEWLIEIDENGSPSREIGLDANGKLVLAGPSEIDYGFWVDSNLKLVDFEDEPVASETFEEIWSTTGIT